MASVSRGRRVERTSRGWAFDAVVTALAGLAAVPYLAREASDQHSPVALSVVIAVVAAPLILRRVYPLPVFAWVLGAGLGAALWDRHLITGAAVLVALYTVAS